MYLQIITFLTVKFQLKRRRRHYSEKKHINEIKELNAFKVHNSRRVQSKSQLITKYQDNIKRIRE